ncbi:protein kintoun [Petaurus breviceps papuanus]|uniref:protein kintoun n=1 Tax=Petaurus breviceps papuanus TaxID=3040969 RepID=UPI0036DAEED6
MASEGPASLLHDLDLSAEEVRKLTSAFEDPEFRRLFGEYAAELSDPANRRRYEEEITALERERGVQVQFVHPEPGHVLRTSLDGAQRCFVNVCSNPLLGRPSSQPGTGEGSARGQLWALPYSLAPGREYLGRRGARYRVYDVIFHPDTLALGQRQERFRGLIDSTALEAVERQFGVTLDKRNAKALKIKYKGTPEAAVLRTPLPGGPPRAPEGAGPGDDLLRAFPYPYPSPEVGRKAPAPPSREEPADRAPTVPRHSLVQRHHVDLQDYRCSRDSCPSTTPRELVVTVELPLLRSARRAVLEVTEKQLLLDSRQPDYRLRLPLPYPVDESRGSAQFHQAKRQLVVTLPVVPPKHSLEPSGPQEEETEVEEAGQVSTRPNGLPKLEGAEDLAGDTGMFENRSQESPKHARIPARALAGEELIDPQEGTAQDQATGMMAIPPRTAGPSPVVKANPLCCTGGQDLPLETVALPPGSDEMPPSGAPSLPGNAGPPGTSGQPLISKADLSDGTGREEPALSGGSQEAPSSGALSFLENTHSPGEPREKTAAGKESLPENTNKVQPRKTVNISENNRGKPLCPPLQCNQDEESLTLLIQVPQVQPQSLQSDLSPNQYKLYFTTQDFVSYSFVMQFAPENKLSTKERKVNISSFNTVIELAKSPESYGRWRKWYFGLSNNCLQERFFVIEENVDEFLEGALNFNKSAPQTQPLIEVLEVSDKKTQIQLKSQELDGQEQLNRNEQIFNINHLPEKENMLGANTENSNNSSDVEKEHSKGNNTSPDSYTAAGALKKGSCGSAPGLQYEPPSASAEATGKSQLVFTKEKIAVYSDNEKQNTKQPAWIEEKELDEGDILQSVRETSMKDGSVQIIKEHVTNCAFTFQNSLLYDLD